jgi:hypothetical protein
MMRSILPLFATALAASAPAFATELVNVPGFRTVELRGGGVVTVVPGPTQRVTIEQGSTQFTRMYVTSDGKLRIDTCNQRCPQHYRLQVVIQSPRAPDLAVSGGGLVTTAGGFNSQSQLAAAVNGGGRIDARSIDVVNISAAVNGGGEVLVRPRSSLSAAVNGGGHVRYWGNPNVSMAVRGGGSVSPGS